GTRQFPFALATRFLELQGGGTIQTFGSVLVGACSSDGTGTFKGNGGFNGGINFNGSTRLSLGAAISTATGTTYYTSPQAVTVADGNPEPACTSTAGNDPADWNSMGDKVSFSASSSEFNPYWAFNSGPTTCTTPYTIDKCELTPAGDTANWTDNCW